jgi:hypothetical protein
MLELTKDFAEGKAEEANEHSRALRHAAWVAELGDRASVDFQTTARSIWRSRYDPEIDNARKALACALSESGDPLIAARIITGFRWLWIDSAASWSCGASPRRHLSAWTSATIHTRLPRFS